MRNKNTWPIYSISDLWVSQCRKQEFYAGKAAIYGLELEMSNCFTPVIAKFQVPVSLYGKWLGILTGCKYRLLIFS